MTSQKDANDWILLLFNYSSEELRYQSHAEHLYAAASVAAFGAASWATVGLKLENYNLKCLSHPAFVAVAGILILSLAVHLRIQKSHTKWIKARKFQSEIAMLIPEAVRDNVNGLKDVVDIPPSHGHRYSKGVVWVAAIWSILFIISITSP